MTLVWNISKSRDLEFLIIIKALTSITFGISVLLFLLSGYAFVYFIYCHNVGLLLFHIIICLIFLMLNQSCWENAVLIWLKCSNLCVKAISKVNSQLAWYIRTCHAHRQWVKDCNTIGKDLCPKQGTITTKNL